MIALADKATLWTLKACAALVIVGALGLWGYSKGRTHGAAHVQAQWDKSVERGKAEVDRLKSEAGKVTVKVETRYLDRIVTVEGKTREIVRQVPVLVPAGACELPAGFRVLHDAAATGSAVPDAAGIADAAPVDAQDVAGTVVENYGACQVIRERLIGLQAWVDQQKAVNP